MRKRLYEIIELSQDNDIVSSIYDTLMMFSIIISIIPLAFKQTYTFSTTPTLLPPFYLS